MRLTIPKTAAARLWLRAWVIVWISAASASADDQSQSSSARDEAIRSIREIRGVHGVSASHARNPSKGCVTHLLDMHYISWDMFVAWMKTRDADAAARDMEAVRAQYEWVVGEVQALQLEHENIIRDIATQFGTALVYVEGLAADDPATREFLMAVQGGERHLHEVARTVPRVNDFLKRFEAAKPGDLSSTDYFKLRHGAPGSLFLSGTLNSIEPAESSAAFNAYWRRLRGKLYSTDANEAREDAIVSTLLKGKMPALIVLGGGHDLVDNLKRLSDETCDYVRIESDAYHALYSKIRKRGWLKPMRRARRQTKGEQNDELTGRRRNIGTF